MYTNNPQYTSTSTGYTNQMGMYPQGVPIQQPMYQTVYQPVPQPVYVQQPVYIQQPQPIIYQQPVYVPPYRPATSVKTAVAAGITAGVINSLLRPHHPPPPHFHHHHGRGFF